MARGAAGGRHPAAGVAGRHAAAEAAVLRACAHDQPPLDLLRTMSQSVRRALPHAAAGWLLTDPATLLGTGVCSVGVPPDLTRRLLEHEVAHHDLNAFTSLARRRRPAARLSAATGGLLSRSSRHRALYAPHGYGDELRAVFRTGDAVWGQVCLTRGDGDPDFTDADVALLQRLSRPVGNALRTSLALRDRERQTPAAQPPGVLLLDGDDNVESLDEAAEHWLRQLPDDGLALPAAVCAVAQRARMLAAGDTTEPPAARVHTHRGGFLSVRGTCLASREGPFRVAVVLEPPRPAELAPLIVALGDLTTREQEITQLLLRGTPTGEIARALWISPHTLRGHVKTIFTKLRVRSRHELNAVLVAPHLG